MPIISEVKFQKIISRIDAEYYKSSYLEIEKKIQRLSENSNFNVVKLKSISSRVRKGIFAILKSEYKTEGVPFLRASNIKKLMIDENNLTFISEARNEKESKTCLHPQDLVIVKSGVGVGKIAIIPPCMSKVNISQDVIGVTINSRKVMPEYVCTYVASKYGQLWFNRNRSIVAQPHLELKPVRELLIPIPSTDHQLKVCSMVNDAINLYYESKNAYSNATNLFLKSVGLNKKFIDKTIQEVKYLDIVKHDRFDAEFFQPKYTRINQILEQKANKGDLCLKELHEIGKLSKGIEVGSKAYLNKGDYVFFRVSNLSTHGAKIGRSTKYIRPNLYTQLDNSYQPLTGEILYSKDGTLGTSLVVESDFPKGIICSGIVKIKTRKGFDPYYIAFSLNSIVCRSQAERHCNGTVIKHLQLKSLKKIIIPLIPSDQQKIVSNFVQESLQKRRASRLLIHNAIKYVEKLLEKGFLEE